MGLTLHFYVINSCSQPFPPSPTLLHLQRLHLALTGWPAVCVLPRLVFFYYFPIFPLLSYELGFLFFNVQYVLK